MNITEAYKTVDVIIKAASFSEIMKVCVPMGVAEMKKYESIRSCISKDRPAIHLAFLESTEAGIKKAAIHAKKYAELLVPVLKTRVIGEFSFTEGNKLMKFATPNDGEIRFWFEVDSKGEVKICHNLEADDTSDEVVAE